MQPSVLWKGENYSDDKMMIRRLLALRSSLWGEGKLPNKTEFKYKVKYKEFFVAINCFAC